jgi:hypothetical protein
MIRVCFFWRHGVCASRKIGKAQQSDRKKEQCHFGKQRSRSTVNRLSGDDAKVTICGTYHLWDAYELNRTAPPRELTMAVSETRRRGRSAGTRETPGARICTTIRCEA